MKSSFQASSVTKSKISSSATLSSHRRCWIKGISSIGPRRKIHGCHKWRYPHSWMVYFMENNGKQWKTRLKWMETTNQRVPDVPACSCMFLKWKEYGKNMERIWKEYGKNTFQTLHFSWDASANDPRPWALHPPKWPGDKDDCRRQGFLTKRIQDLSLFRMAVLLTSPNISFTIFTRHRFTNPFSVFCSLLALFCRTCLFLVLGFHKFRRRVLDDACPPVRSWNRDGQIASPIWHPACPTWRNTVDISRHQ